MSYISYFGAYSKEKVNFHKHKDYELFIYSSGKGKLHIEEKVYDAEQGMIVVMPPNVEHGSISYDDLRYVAILGNSGSGKSYSTSKILQSIFYDAMNNIPFRTNMFLFDAYGEYQPAFH